MGLAAVRGARATLEEGGGKRGVPRDWMRPTTAGYCASALWNGSAVRRLKSRRAAAEPGRMTCSF